jgi:hypothetical protein
LVVEKEGFTLDLWEKIAFGLAYGNREHADQSYHEIVKKSAQFDQKEKELSHKIEHIKSLGSPANPSLAFLVCGGVGILMGLACLSFTSFQLFAFLLLAVGGGFFLAGWRKRIHWQQVVAEWNREINLLQDELDDNQKQAKQVLETVPPLAWPRVAKLNSRFALVSIDDQRFLLDLEQKVSSDKGKQILNLNMETSDKIDKVRVKIEKLEKGLPPLLRLEGDNPQNLEKPWGEEREICETADELGKVLKNTALVALEYGEASQAYFDLVIQSQPFSRNLDSPSDTETSVLSSLEPVLEAATQADKIRQNHGCSARQYIMQLTDRIQDLFSHFGSHRKEALEQIICRQVESIMQVFPDKNRVFLNPELNPPPILLPEEILEEKADWLKTDPYQRAKDSGKITEIIRQTKTLQELVHRACETLQTDFTEGRRKLVEEAQKALEGELSERRARVLRLLRHPDTQEELDGQTSNQNLSAVYRINRADGIGVSTHFSAPTSGSLFKKIESFKRDWFWECSLTRKREKIEDLNHLGTSSMGKINFTLLRDMWDTFWASRRQEKLRIIREKEAELRLNLNEESKDLREEARIFTEELRHFRDMINEEIRSTERSQSSCRRLIQQLQELRIFDSNEAQRIEGMLESKDGQFFFTTSDKLERCLEDEMRIASLRRQQTLTGIPVDSEILRLDEPATKNAVLSRQSTEESARK